MNPFLRLPDGTQVPVRDGMVLGRTQCDLVIDDTKASRRHARIISEGGVVEVEDLNSSNGTFLNGKRIDRKLLRPGDELQIGTTVMVLVEEAGGAVAVDDDVDLFGDGDVGDEPSPSAAAPAGKVVHPEPVRVSIPPPEVRAQIEAQRQREAADREVLEFEDEVIEFAARPAPAAPATGAGDEPIVVQKDRVLQFQRKEDKGGLLGDDLAQMGGLQKFALIAVALAAAVGIAYGAMQLAS